MVNSGSSANIAIIQCLLNLNKLKTGDKVGFSALTWSTNVMPLIQLGLIPIPIDINLNTLNVSSKTLHVVLRRHDLKAVILTNLLGFCDDIDVIEELCNNEKIVLIEDNCESLGSVYKGKKLGNYSIASTFSFYVGHHLSTIEGGAICTDDEEIGTMLRLIRAHGWDRNLSYAKKNSIRRKYNINSSFYSRYTFYELGYNFRPTEISGYLGYVQMKYLDKIVAAREKNFKTLAPILYSQTDKYYPLEYGHMDRISNFAVPLICRSVKTREQLVKKCAGKVEIRPIVGGDMTNQPFFSKYVRPDTPISQNKYARLAHDQGLYFGNNEEVSERDLQTLLGIFA